MKTKALIIDDEPNVADTLAMVLADSGFEVRVEYFGRDGLRRAIEFCPDIVITDFMMSDVNGLEVAIQIALQLPQCRILLMSAAPEDARYLQEKRCFGQVFEVLAKPLNPRILLSRLRSFGNNLNHAVLLSSASKAEFGL